MGNGSVLMKMNIFIIGTGLIGGSLGLALIDSPFINIIYGYDPDKEALGIAKDIGAINEAVDLKTGAIQAEIIFICSPLSNYKEIISAIKPFLYPGTIVTDVGSTKQEVMKMFEDLPQDVWGIGGHPMAGSELKGIKGADQYLFENAVYVLTPESVPMEQLDRLITVIKPTGAKIEILDAVIHDELVATVSHIPHLTAVALVNLTEGTEGNLTMAAGGFRDTTRIASSNPELWEDILLFNRHHILNQLDKLIDIINNFKEIIDQQDSKELLKTLNKAKDIRDQIPHARKGLIPSYQDVICIVPDQPGIIGKLGQILGEKDINIVDIEILRVREGDGGTIRIGVPTFEATDLAVKILLDHGIKAWVR
ncbi:MAG TPA: prephenate dehydrogenase [Syntrophomonadaceae bacterium]|nr:prephenate dehydrogenase [Syntrophomonadaceae bacterium]